MVRLRLALFALVVVLSPVTCVLALPSVSNDHALVSESEESRRSSRRGPGMTVASFRRLLRSISDEEFAALLRELGVALYERDIRDWRVLSGISDELLDR